VSIGFDAVLENGNNGKGKSAEIVIYWDAGTVLSNRHCLSIINKLITGTISDLTTN